MSQREREFVYGCDFHVSSSSFNDTLYLFKTIALFKIQKDAHPQCKKYGALWVYECHFHVDQIHLKRSTFDCSIIANFIQDSRASALDTNLLSSKLDYCGTIHDMIEVGVRRCTIFF